MPIRPNCKFQARIHSLFLSKKLKNTRKKKKPNIYFFLLTNVKSPSSTCLFLFIYSTTPSSGLKGIEEVNSVRDHTVAFYPDSPPGLFQEKSRCTPKGCIAKHSAPLYNRCNTCKVPLYAFPPVFSLFVLFFCQVRYYGLVPWTSYCMPRINSG